MMNYSSKITGILILLTGWLLASCNAEAPGEPGTGDRFILRASLAEGVTKTTLSFEDDVYKVLWQTGDKVSVNGNLSEAVAASDNEKKAVDFTVNATVTEPYMVLYPGTSSTDVIALPATQNYVAGSFDPNAAASFGNAHKSGSDYIASLTHFCGVIRFALNGTATLDRIELNALSGEKLFGDFTLAKDSKGFTGSWSGGTAGTLTYSFGSSGLALSSTDTPIYIAIPAQTYASGIEALVYQKDGAFMRLKFWGSGVTLGADDIVVFESKTYAAGRTENIFAINSLTAEAGGEPTAEAPGITVAMYNVMRFDSDDRPSAATTGDNNGKIARPANAIVPNCAEMQVALGQAIYNTAADVIGFNEIGDDMYNSGQTYSLQDIASAQGASYTWKLNFPASSSGNYHYCNGFAYKSSVLTLNESGKTWLRYNSESYSTSSQTDSGDPNRTVVWAKFTHKVSGKVFYFFVTQLPTYSQDGGSGTSNTNMAGGVNAFATAKAGSYPQILVGDMNSAPGHNNQAGYNKLKNYWTDAYEAVSAAGNLAAFYTTYPGTQSGTGDTYLYSILQFTKNHPERRVDHIMTHGACTAQSYRTIRNVYEFGSGEDAVTCASSDHLPVVSYITLD
ncbi:MAG: hypothetical protein IKX45_06880 [Bacteroidales bacterium]|nr:hypothetical protein [Bacteroidales bacterium]